MQQIHLTYEQWRQVHPTYRSMIDRVPHVAAYDDGQFELMRVVIERPQRRAAPPARCTGQLRITGA